MHVCTRHQRTRRLVFSFVLILSIGTLFLSGSIHFERSKFDAAILAQKSSVPSRLFEMGYGTFLGTYMRQTGDAWTPIFTGATRGGWYTRLHSLGISETDAAQAYRIKPLSASAANPYDVLLFSKTAAYRHASIPTALATIDALAASHNFTTTHTEDAAFFTDANLARFSAVAFVMTSGDVLNEAQQAAFERYIRGGGGYVGIHSASDTEYSWPWYGDLMGAFFDNHPAIQEASILVEETDHVSTQHLNSPWVRTDEWYNFRRNPRTEVTVLAALDESTYSGGTMGDHPIAWYHEYDGGRAWYTGGGHTRESYSEPDFVQHILGGIQYAAGLTSPPTETPTPTLAASPSISPTQTAVATGPPTSTAVPIITLTTIATKTSPATPTVTPTEMPTLTPAGGVITGRVYMDENENGIFDAGESPVAGITAMLVATGTAGQTTLDTAITDGEGIYRFFEVASTAYMIAFVLPPMYVPADDVVVGVQLGEGNATAPDFGVVPRNSLFLPLTVHP